MLLFRSLWNGFRVPNRVHLTVFGSLYLRDTASEPPCQFCTLSSWQMFGSFVPNVMQTMPNVQ